MENKKKNILFICLKSLASLAILALDIFLLIRFDYIPNLIYIDNLLGFLPVFLIILFTISGLLLLWKKHSKDKIYLPIIMACWMIASVALFPNSLKKKWVFTKEIVTVGSDGDVEPYAPFVEGTKAVKLDGTPSVKIDNDMPILDGALALYPVYSAVAQNIYNKDNYVDEVRFTNTIRGFNGLIDGSVDIFFGAKPSQNQYKYAKDHAKEIYLTPIGLEAFVFLVPKSNPINNITTQQVKNIYSGKIDYWQTLGWNKGGRILKFQRPEGSGSQTMLQYVMGNLPIESPQPTPNMDIIGSNSLMKQLSVEFGGVQPALGYSFKFFSTIMNPNPDVKLLSLNDIEPSAENISSGKYQYSNNFYAITVGEPQGNNKKVIDWITSEEGQNLIEKTGYSKRKVS